MENDPKASNSDFYHMLRDTDESQQSGYKIHTVLYAVLELLNLKVEFNMTVNCYNRMVVIIKKMLLKDEKLVGSFYVSKKLMKGLGMRFQIKVLSSLWIQPNSLLFMYF